MPDECTKWVPLRSAVSEAADEFARVLRCSPETAVDRAWRAVFQKMANGAIESRANYWDVVSGTVAESTSIMGSTQHGDAIPFVVWAIFEGGNRQFVTSEDWVVGDFEYFKVTDDEQYKHIIIWGVSVPADAIAQLFDPSEVSKDDLRAVAVSRLEERRGAKRKWDWEGAICAIVARANTPDGLPSGHGAQAEIGRALSEWFRENQDGEPAASEIGARAAKIIQAASNYRK